MAWPFAHVGAPNYDSGFVDVPDTLTVLSVATLWLMGANIVNDSDDEVTIRITDTAGQPIVPTIPVPARSVVPPYEWPFLPVTGLKWEASAAGLVAKVWGYE